MLISPSVSEEELNTRQISQSKVVLTGPPFAGIVATIILFHPIV